jgi:hypothetical protein
MYHLLVLNCSATFFYLELLLNSHKNTMETRWFWRWTDSHSLNFSAFSFSQFSMLITDLKYPHTHIAVSHTHHTATNPHHVRTRPLAAAHDLATTCTCIANKLCMQLANKLSELSTSPDIHLPGSRHHVACCPRNRHNSSTPPSSSHHTSRITRPSPASHHVLQSFND